MQKLQNRTNIPRHWILDAAELTHICADRFLKLRDILKQDIIYVELWHRQIGRSVYQVVHGDVNVRTMHNIITQNLSNKNLASAFNTVKTPFQWFWNIENVVGNSNWAFWLGHWIYVQLQMHYLPVQHHCPEQPAGSCWRLANPTP